MQSHRSVAMALCHSNVTPGEELVRSTSEEDKRVHCCLWHGPRSLDICRPPNRRAPRFAPSDPL